MSNLRSAGAGQAGKLDDMTRKTTRNTTILHTLQAAESGIQDNFNKLATLLADSSPLSRLDSSPVRCYVD